MEDTVKKMPAQFVQISVNPDGDVVLNVGITISPQKAMMLAKALAGAAKAGLHKKPVIVPAAAFPKPS